MIAPLAPVAQPRPKADAACAHCGLPVPPRERRDGELQFCCSGCQTVYSVINSCGLDGYYKLRRATEEAGAPALATGRGYVEFDDPVFQRLYIRPAHDGLVETELVLEGLHCAACVWLVEKLPQIIPGVLESRLDYRRATVQITWDPMQATLSRIAQALDSLGYPPHPARDVSTRELRKLEDRRFLVRIAVAGAAMGNVMLLGMALYSGEFAFMAAEYEVFFRWLSMLIGIVSLAWPGSIFFKGAWAALRTRTLHLDLPIALGLGAGGLWGAFNVVRGSGDIYFDSLTGLVFFLLCARWVQHRQQRRAADSVELLYSLTPTSARRVEGDPPVVREVAVESLIPGDIVEVRAGDSVPVDGIIIQGSSSLDQSLLSGESLPVSVIEGDAAHAGSVNLTAAIRVRVCTTGVETRVGRLMRLVSDCAARRAPLVQMADRLAGWFVAALVTLAALTAMIWWRTSPEFALDNAIALLIVACPCGLGLATPLAMSVAIGRAARREILVKGGDALERLSRPGTIYLDKTGTITAGQTRLVRWSGDQAAQPLVAALEAQSSHPIARALVQAIDPNPLFGPATDVQQTTGGGIAGAVAGQAVTVGSPTFIMERFGPLPGALQREVQQAAAEALTPIIVAVEGRPVAVAALGDPIRDDSAEVIRNLQRLGWTVGILSGDHPAVVSAVGRALGLPETACRGGISPEQKLAIVTEAMRDGPVVMVGDGVNDAAALAAATVGIAVQGGAEASLAAADVYLNRPGLGPILELLDAARRTVRTIRRNIMVSIGYNVLAASLAMTGFITPILGAIMMPISSFTVLTVSFRSRTFGDRPCR
jgi:P-type Cu2+ transporter